MVLTGNLDVDRLILNKLSNTDILNICKLNKYVYYKVCNETFFRNLVYTRYETLIKYKDYVKTRTWKSFYFSVLFYIDKLRNKYNYEYNDKNRSPELEYLIRKLVPSYISYTTNYIYYAFKCSSRVGHFHIIKYLIEQEVISEKSRIEALKTAVIYGHLTIVKYLVEAGVDKSDTLELASEYGHLEIIKYLVDNGSKISAKSLANASEFGHLKVVKYFIQKGADVSADNNYALKRAIDKGDLDVVKYLVETGADIHAEDNYALRRASHNGYLHIVEFLTEHGADIHADNDKSLIWACQNGYLPVVKYLVDKGCNSDAALRMAIKWGHLEIFEFLQEKKVNID